MLVFDNMIFDNMILTDNPVIIIIIIMIPGMNNSFVRSHDHNVQVPVPRFGSVRFLCSFRKPGLGRRGGRSLPTTPGVITGMIMTQMTKILYWIELTHSVLCPRGRGQEQEGMPMWLVHGRVVALFVVVILNLFMLPVRQTM